jgi:predicted transcriptional regulator YheO
LCETGALLRETPNARRGKTNFVRFSIQAGERHCAIIGENCEIVIHDLSDPEKSVVAIENGQLTGRNVGDSLDELGVQLLRQPPGKDLINYRTATRSGKVLCSSSVFLRDETGEIFGAFCINYDISMVA